MLLQRDHESGTYQVSNISMFGTVIPRVSACFLVECLEFLCFGVMYSGEMMFVVLI